MHKIGHIPIDLTKMDFSTQALTDYITELLSQHYYDIRQNGKDRIIYAEKFKTMDQIICLSFYLSSRHIGLYKCIRGSHYNYKEGKIGHRISWDDPGLLDEVMNFIQRY